jgi:hypothetical protein
MDNVRNQFYEKLIFEELGPAEENDLCITIPISSVPKSSNTDFENIQFPESLNNLYRQVDYIEISWSIWPVPTYETQYDIPTVFKEDAFLKENYWDEKVSWGIIHEQLSGSIGIQKAEDILNPEFCKEHIFNEVIDGLNSEEFIPFDLHWNIMACLKKENGKILDNVWIVYYEGEEMYDMKVTIDKYMELCYKAKGFYDWQFAYLFRNGENFQFMKRYLPMFFPHLELDLSDFGM